MTDLRRDTLLECVWELRLRRESNGEVTVWVGDESFRFGSHCLPVLGAFAQTRSFQQGLDLLSSLASGPRDWIDLADTIAKLHLAGILRDPSSTGSPAPRPSGYDAARVHIAMLDDTQRTARYLAAIREVVCPGDVVLDVGTGTGVLAVAAAQAGARRVYAVEASGIADRAAEMFQANDVADRVTLIRGWSTQIELPERADVLVSEMIGDEPLGERLLEMTLDARRRLLTPQARLVPNRVTVWGVPLEVDGKSWTRHVFTAETTCAWTERYGVDFAALTRAEGRSLGRLAINPFDTHDWSTLSEPIPLAQIDLATFTAPIMRATSEATVTRSGQMNGLLVCFDAELSPAVRLSTLPWLVEPDNHWRSPIWLLNPTLSLRDGDRISVSYSYGVDGQEASVTVSCLEAAGQ